MVLHNIIFSVSWPFYYIYTKKNLLEKLLPKGDEYLIEAADFASWDIETFGLKNMRKGS
jgi:hypothetical protein